MLLPGSGEPIMGDPAVLEAAVELRDVDLVGTFALGRGQWAAVAAAAVAAELLGSKTRRSILFAATTLDLGNATSSLWRTASTVRLDDAPLRNAESWPKRKLPPEPPLTAWGGTA